MSIHRQVLVFHREDPDSEWEFRESLADSHPSLSSIAAAMPPKRLLWAVVPILPDFRDGVGLSTCRWYWQMRSDRGINLCTRPIGHGSVCVDRVHHVVCPEPHRFNIDVTRVATGHLSVVR